jgi:Na+/melibiose symporter-like transporter
MIAGNLAILATGVFTGGAVYVSVVEHPARMSCDTNVAVAQWRPSYRRATLLQASLAVVGTLLALLAWHNTGARAWLAGAVCLGAIIPFTLIVMFPVNKQLQDDHLDASSEEAKTLLDRWGYLHAARSFLALMAFALMLAAHG